MNVSDEGVVCSIWDKDNVGQPVSVGINPHSPVYVLYRDDPQFSRFLAVLEESKFKRARVHFCYATDPRGMRLTFVELKK